MHTEHGMDAVRAWKDPEYRSSLGGSAPEHPAGDGTLVALDDTALAQAAGAGTDAYGTLGCCGPGYHWTWMTMCGLACIATETICP